VREPSDVDTTTAGPTIQLGLWIVALLKYPAKVEPHGWPGTAALRSSLVGGRKESQRVTATPIQNVRVILFAAKTTVLPLAGRAPILEWTVVCLWATHHLL